jgi:tight adherence protein B
MNLGDDIRQIIVMVTAALAVAGIILVLFYPLLVSSQAGTRVRNVVEARRPPPGQQRGGGGKAMEVPRESRRKQVQESLKQIEARESQRKRTSLRLLITQAGLQTSIGTFWMMSLASGVVLTVIPLFAGVPWYLSLVSGFVGFLGLPRWFLGYLRKRHQEKFLSELPDAIDVMVRGLRSGLPISDAMKIIAAESPKPIGPEFWEVVEGQRVGITIEQGLERMFERIPLQEVSFLAIVMNIQSKTGGNLTEPLSNLAKVLRDRRKMKSKIRSMSQEAKSSAIIIGCLPFLIMGVLTFLSPTYLSPLFETRMGNILLGGCAVWMLVGILVMRKMINFAI